MHLAYKLLSIVNSSSFNLDLNLDLSLNLDLKQQLIF